MKSSESPVVDEQFTYGQQVLKRDFPFIYLAFFLGNPLWDDRLKF